MGIFAPQLAAGVGSCGVSFVMRPLFYEEHRAAHITPNSQINNDMRVIMEQGDKPEMREVIYGLQKCGLEFVIVEDETKQERRLLSDDEIKEAILSVMPFFSVRSQWVAIYRILVDYYGFPEEVAAFCSRISKLMSGTEIYFTIDYQSVQKPLAANGILQKPYSQWKVFCAKKGDRVFTRQKMIAERLLKALGIT